MIIFKPVELIGSTVSDFTNCDRPRLILVAKKVTLAMMEIEVCPAGADIIQVSLRYNLLHYWQGRGDFVCWRGFLSGHFYGNKIQLWNRKVWSLFYHYILTFNEYNGLPYKCSEDKTLFQLTVLWVRWPQIWHNQVYSSDQLTKLDKIRLL